MMNRRTFLKQTGAFSAALLLPACLNKVKEKKKNPYLLVVSGWQDVNIGDIAHTPGLLHILQMHLPDATITLWKRSKSEKVEALLKKNFPNIEILYGNPDKDFTVTDNKILEAINRADVFIHVSGPSVVAASIGKLKEVGVTKPEIRFVPDATFALNIQNEENAHSFLTANNLEDRKFICVIPRLRKTPYWLIRRKSYTEEQIAEITALNDKWKGIDHAKAREAIVRWVRETGNKVLICPEMTYQVDIMDELLIDPLPDDVKRNVVKRGYWLPDEAASLYSKAFCVLSFECHSPIISLRNGTPAFYLRQPEDTIKGQMYYDLGFDNWVFEINNTTGKQIADRLMEVYSDYDSAQAYRKRGMDKASELFDMGVKIVSQFL